LYDWMSVRHGAACRDGGPAVAGSVGGYGHPVAFRRLSRTRTMTTLAAVPLSGWWNK
jgi:hypothetical protein